VLAEVAGTVREVAVAAGDGVQEGDVLAVIDEG
jgi:biotin carboxyl carrier protein